MNETIEQLPTAGLEQILTIQYIQGTRLDFWAGEPVTEDGDEIAPVGDKCVYLIIDGSQMLLSDNMAMDIVRGFWRSLWGMATWRERVKMLMEFWR